MKKKTIKAWIIPPLKDYVSPDGWILHAPIFTSKKEAAPYASKESIIPCTITYTLPTKQ